MPSGKPGTRKPRPPDLRDKPAQGKPLDGSKNPGGSGRPVEWTQERIDILADSLLMWGQSPDAKYLERFCQIHGTYPQKLTELAEKSERFSEALKGAKASCAANLAMMTEVGAMPPAFGIFALKQRGWTDKQEIEHSGEIKSTVVQVQLPQKS